MDANLIGDSSQQTTTHFLGGLVNSLFKRKHIGGTMTFDDHAIQTQQAGAIVATRIKVSLEGTQHWPGDQTSQARQRGSLEFTAQTIAYQFGQAL